MNLNLQLTALFVLILTFSYSQDYNVEGTWEYSPTKTIKTINKTDAGIRSIIDGDTKIDYFNRVGANRYQSTTNSNLYVEFKSDELHLQFNTQSGKQNTWVRFDTATSPPPTPTPTPTPTPVNDNKQGLVNLGVGLLPTLGAGSGGLFPLSVSYDHPFSDKITIGGYAGYLTSNFDAGFGFDFKYSYIIFGARGTYDLDLIDSPKIDTYAGVMLGYNLVSASGDCGNFCSSSASSIGYAGIFGGRYELSNSLKLFAEIGYGISYLTVGVSFAL